MKRRFLTFVGPRRVETRAEELAPPGEGEVLVESRFSAVSAGTEGLVYRGELGPSIALDASLPSLHGAFRYPLRYGYAAVGEVLETGKGVQTLAVGQTVFSFHPHASHFVVREEDAFAVPSDVQAEGAALLPTMETAVNLLLDARPLIGERAIVVGQGVVGLLTTFLLTRLPLECLWVVDPIERRRKLAAHFGATRAVGPEGPIDGDFDLAFELSGSPRALNLALAATGVEGRVVVGSWYGDEEAPIELGTHFHRGRLRILSSQVSRLGAELTTRWSKSRRLRVAWEALSRLDPSKLVTHRFPLEEAPEAYRLLDENPADCLQVLLTYT